MSTWLTRNFCWLYWSTIAVLAAGTLWTHWSNAAVSGEWRVNLLKGSITVSPASVGATQEAAWLACQARIPASAATTTTYRCQTPVYVATVTADPPPPTCAPPPPADLTQPATCPVGTSGSWTQRKAHTCVGTTWTADAQWTPVAPPAGACVAIPPPPPVTAPQNLTGTATANQTNPANSNVKLTWTAVPNVTVYEVERCTVTTTGCVFGFLADATAAEYSNNNLPPGITYRYRVRTWTPSPPGPYSASFEIKIPANAPPPPPPPATGTAKLEWTAPTLNTDGTPLTNLVGYHVLFGVGTAALSQQIVVAGGANTTYEVTGLTPGTWVFAVRAVSSSGITSATSNSLSKVVP